MRCSDFFAFDLLDQPVFMLSPDADNRPVCSFMNRAALTLAGKTVDLGVGRSAYALLAGRVGCVVYTRQCDVWGARRWANTHAPCPRGRVILRDLVDKAL